MKMLAIFLLLCGAALAEDSATVGDYAVEHSQQCGLTIRHVPTGATLLAEGRFHERVATVKEAKGQITLTFANNDSLTIATRGDSRFLELTWTLRGSQSGERTLTNLPLLSFLPARQGKAPVTVGTGGPAKPGDGSYMFLVNADAATRAGLVTAWLTSERASGVVLTDKDQRVTARMDYGAFALAPGKTETTDRLLIGWFDDALRGLESYADEIAKHHEIKLPPQKSVYCTWYHARASNEAQFARNTEMAARELKPFGLDVLQIDDGWQPGQSKNGPKKNFTIHDPDGPYPSGMKKTADDVIAAGMIPGIWWMPFAGTAPDPYYADKQHFFVRDDDGAPREVKWGGTCLDMTHPEALAYVRENARRIAEDWHYQYFKLDGLWTGIAPAILYVNNGFREDDYGVQRRFDASITPVEAYRKGMKAVRDGAGDNVFLLGCNLAQNMRTMGASYGLFDAMRVGPDNNANNWKSLVGGVFSSANRYFLHGRVWYNDPDPHYVRPSVPIQQARTLSSWVGLSGFLNTSSESYEALPAERLDLLRRTLPAHKLKARPVDYLEQRVARVWIVSDGRASPARHAIGFFNWEVENTEPITIDRPLAACDLDPKKAYVGFDFWRNEFLPEIRDRVQVVLPHNECRLWCLREKTDHPMVVSTSRHVTQGIVDIVEEQWDSAGRVLSGKSRIVGGDPYELRIWTPAAYGRIDVSCSKGADIRLGECGEHGVRIHINGAQSATVAWKVSFTP